MATRAMTAADVLDGHTVLDVSCLDRLYLNGYVPNAQVGGQVVLFLRHRGFPIPSPAALGKITEAFRRKVRSFAEANDVRWIVFGKGQRKIDVVRPLMDRAAASGRSQVVAIGAAQECLLFPVPGQDLGERARAGQAAVPGRGDRLHRAVQRVRRLRRPGRAAGGLRPAAAGHHQRVLRPLDHRLPLPLDQADRDAGYWWRLSMRQVETSRTLVFDDPRRARRFVEALIADNLDLGRPEQVEVIFARRITAATPGRFATRVLSAGDQVTLNISYRASRVKQYLKDGRALRIETVINDPADLGCLRGLEHLDELQAKARAINDRVLDAEHVGQGSAVFESPAFARVSQPTVTDDGRRAPAMRFGDPRVQALAGALAHLCFAVTGVTNKSLRALMTGPLGTRYGMSQASYDLARCRRNGLITRVPGRNRYTLTPDGRAFAIFYTRVHDRVLFPLMAAPTGAPPPVRQALRVLDRHIGDTIAGARLPTAA